MAELPSIGTVASEEQNSRPCGELLLFGLIWCNTRALLHSSYQAPRWSTQNNQEV